MSRQTAKALPSTSSSINGGKIKYKTSLNYAVSRVPAMTNREMGVCVVFSVNTRYRGSTVGFRRSLIAFF